MFRLIAWLIGSMIRLSLTLIFFATPVLGFWLASSLAAYEGGPHWLAWAAGACLFPVIPGAWEFHAWTHRKPEGKPWFTTFDRLCLRTFAVGLAFNAVLLCMYPQSAFVALSTRGDWMLDDVKDPRSAQARRILFASAGGLEWLYNLTKSNPYKALIDPQANQRSEEAAKECEQQQKQAKQTDQIIAMREEQEQFSTKSKTDAEKVEERTIKKSEQKSTRKPGQAAPKTFVQRRAELEGKWKTTQRLAQETAHKQAQKSTQKSEQQIAQKQEVDSAQKAEQISNQELGQDSTQTDEQQSTLKVGQDSTQQTEQDSIEKPEQDSKQKTANKKTSNKKNEEDSTQEPEQKPIHKEKVITNPKMTVAQWPWRHAKLHPAVAKMPLSVETSIQSVAHYIAEQEPDRMQRIKALHDYVADRIAYDTKAFYSKNYPPQDAETVFRTRKGVCAGYSNLMCALADAIDEKIVVVTGDARDNVHLDKLSEGGHAWNAACINNRWYLIDVTWDAGTVTRAQGFRKRYRTDYLLPPPEVMIADHFPDKSTWQLLDEPLSQGDFLRQPMLGPSFHAASLKLIQPTKAINETDSRTVAVVVQNPTKKWLMVELEQNGKKIAIPHELAINDETAHLQCLLPGKGNYRFDMFANQQQYGSYGYVGSLDFVNR